MRQLLRETTKHALSRPGTDSHGRSISGDYSTLRQELGEAAGVLSGHVTIGLVPAAEPVAALLMAAFAAKYHSSLSLSENRMAHVNNAHGSNKRPARNLLGTIIALRFANNYLEE